MRRLLTSRGAQFMAWPILFLLLFLLPASAVAGPVGGQDHGRLAMLRLPFIANQGQVAPEVAYYAPTFVGTLFVTQQGPLAYALAGRPLEAPRGTRRIVSAPGWTLTETLMPATPSRPVRPVGPQPAATAVTDVRRSDPTREPSALATYENVSFTEGWPGVTVSLRARGASLGKLFVVAPGRPDSASARAAHTTWRWTRRVTWWRRTGVYARDVSRMASPIVCRTPSRRQRVSPALRFNALCVNGRTENDVLARAPRGMEIRAVHPSEGAQGVRNRSGVGPESGAAVIVKATTLVQHGRRWHDGITLVRSQARTASFLDAPTVESEKVP